MNTTLWDTLAHHARTGELENFSSPLREKLYGLSEELSLVLKILAPEARRF